MFSLSNYIYNNLQILQLVMFNSVPLFRLAPRLILSLLLFTIETVRDDVQS